MDSQNQDHLMNFKPFEPPYSGHLCIVDAFCPVPWVYSHMFQTKIYLSSLTFLKSPRFPISPKKMTFSRRYGLYDP